MNRERNKNTEFWANTLLNAYIDRGCSNYDLKRLGAFLDELTDNHKMAKEFFELMTMRISGTVNEYPGYIENELDTRVQDTNLPNGLKQTLLLAGKKTMRDVIKLPKSFVKGFRNIGSKKIAELEEWFRKRDLPWN